MRVNGGSNSDALKGGNKQNLASVFTYFVFYILQYIHIYTYYATIMTINGHDHYYEYDYDYDYDYDHDYDHDYDYYYYYYYGCG